MRGWQTAPLGKVATIVRDALQPGEIEPGTLYVGLEHIESGGKLLAPKPVDAGELASAKFQFDSRHVLYGKLRPYLAKIACPEFEGICSTDILPVLPGPKLERRYLLHFLRQPAMVEFATSRSVGANLPRLSPSTLASFEMPLPPLPEQRRIATILDKADELRAKRRAALAELDTLVQAIFLEMFGDPAVNPKGWKSARLADCTGRIQIGPFGSLLHQEDYVAGGVPLVNPMHIKDGVIVPDQEQTVTKHKHAELGLYHLRCGDVIMGRRGEMGRCAIVTPENTGLLCGTGSLFITPMLGVTTSMYLFATLSSQSMKKKLEGFSLGATLPNLNRTIIEELVVPLPTLSDQEHFAAQVASAKALRGHCLASGEQFDALFSSLQHRAFRGEL